MKNNFKKFLNESFFNGNPAADKIVNKFKREMEKITGLKYEIARKEITGSDCVTKFNVTTSTGIWVGSTSIIIWTDSKDNIVSVDLLDKPGGIHTNHIFVSSIAFRIESIFSPEKKLSVPKKGGIYFNVIRSEDNAAHKIPDLESARSY